MLDGRGALTVLAHLVEALETAPPEPIWGEEVGRLVPHPAYTVKASRDRKTIKARLLERKIAAQPVR